MPANLENSAMDIGLEKNFVPVPKKEMPKNAETAGQLHSFHILVK